MPAWLDVTDLAEFLVRRESVSGVQRVIAETAPLLGVACGAGAVVLDRRRGCFVALEPAEASLLLDRGARSGSDATRDELAAGAAALLDRAASAPEVAFGRGDVLVVLGALWIADALMAAVRHAHAQGARVVDLLYDLTPVLDAGHTPAVRALFERYLDLLMACASRVPAISRASRRDFERACEAAGVVPPPGEATGLPGGLAPGADGTGGDDPPWPRPYALLVGTVEARKNHLVAFRAWERLVARHGASEVPDLVCVGRLGWNANAFLREMARTNGLGGKVSVLSASTSDADLARLYAGAEFTVYPSRYEGWGLPVSESLAFGRLPIVADNSSLREAGGDLAVYVATDDADALAAAIEEHALDREARARHEARIAADRTRALTWDDVAAVLAREIEAAAAAEGREPMVPEVELGREYVLGAPAEAPDAGYADQVMAWMHREGTTPMLGQPRGTDDARVTDAAIVGPLGSPQSWGIEVRPGRRVDLRVRRPVVGPLVLMLATRSMPGVVTVELAGPGGQRRQDLHLGSVLLVPLGDGRAGEPAQASLTVIDATDTVEGFLGLRSLAVVREGDHGAQVAALTAAAAALRQELDFLQGTRSWRLTAPLRRWKGRGAR